MTLLSNLVIPLLSLAIGLRTWWLLHRHGWNKALPVFSSYVGFYCITLGALLPLSHWSWYPQRIQPTLCKLYSWSYSGVSVITTLILLVVVYELFAYTATRRAVRTWPFGVCVLLTIILLLAWGGADAKGYKGASACCAFERFSGVVVAGGILALILFLSLFLILKKLFDLPFGRGISLIVTSLAILYCGDLAFSVVAYNYGSSLATAAGTQLVGLVSVVMWFIAVREPPGAPFRESS